jgi:hypothetical protein
MSIDTTQRGEGTVTKRPLLLTLHNTGPNGGKWAELPDLGKTKYTVFSVLEKKIAEQNKSFTDVPLRVDIYSR